jgi:hypothetical protein
MATKKAKLDAAARRVAEILQEHMETLPYPEAKAMRKEIHELAVKSSRSATRGKASRSRRNADPRLLSRASSKPA